MGSGSQDEKTAPLDPVRVDDRSPVDLIGRTLGQFAVSQLLAAGGNGKVYLADDLLLGRTVVIKVLVESARVAPNKVERFLREARLASRLDHPYAAHIYGYGAESDGLLWIAMEHVRGVTLDAVIRERGAMPVAVFGPLFVRLCEVVHSAHELGIVHRDIKGNNVMVVERSGQLLPKLLDFGIAKLDTGEDFIDDDVATTDERITQVGTTLGTPLYMAPEQWQDAAEVDSRADIYALGVLAYFSLAKKFPFESRSRDELRAAHMSTTPDRLTRVPGALADAVAKALAKSPSERFATALDFAAAISSVVGGGGAESVPAFELRDRDGWLRNGPQPISDTVARLYAASSTVEADAALRDLVAIVCRWLAVLALANVTSPSEEAKESARWIETDASAPWLRFAVAALPKQAAPAGLREAFSATDLLEALAERLDARDPARTRDRLARDLADAAAALDRLEPILRYRLVVGTADGVESWSGQRRRERERVVVWSELADRDVALLDAGGHIVTRLSPFVQVIQPLPSLEPELFLLWRTTKRSARLLAAPWGFEHDDDNVGERLASLTTEERVSATSLDEESPYLGLAAYGVGDARRFVGREVEVEALVNRLVRAPMVAVLGASGVGKSSFVHAGVVSRLGTTYRTFAIRPGRHPMRALATAIGSEASRASVIAKLRALGDEVGQGVVVVVDQLEELVTLCDDIAEREEFGAVLTTAASGSRAAVRVLATLRDDFAGVIEDVDAMRGHFEVFVLASPSRDALRRIVTEPARRAGIAIDTRIVDDIVESVAGRPAALALLSFTAARLWQTRDPQKRQIEHDVYLAIGGVAGALATYADQIYESLSDRDRNTVRDLLARLVAPNGTRVPLPRRELEQLPDGAAVIDRLVDSRLLVARDEDDVESIEVVHECLAERWPRLARWRREDAADRALLADLTTAARRWQEQARRTDLLWRGEALRDLRALASRATLTDVERTFADASDRAARRARFARRAMVAAALAVAAAVAAVMAYFAFAARDSAKLADDRLTTSLVAQGRRELADGRSLQALAYFDAALRRGDDGAGLRLMIAYASRGFHDLVATSYSPDHAVTIARDSTWVAISDGTDSVRFVEANGTPLGQLAAGVGHIDQLAAGPSDRLLVAGATGVAVISVHDRQVLAHLPAEPDWWSVNLGPADDEVTFLLKTQGIAIDGFDGQRRRALEARFPGSLHPVFDPSGRYLYAYASGSLSLIDLVAMTKRELTHSAAAEPSGSHDRTARGYIDASGDVVLLATDGSVLHTIASAGHPDRLAFSPDGDEIAVAIGGNAEVYRRDGTSLRHLQIPDGALLAVRGDDLWTGDRLGVVRHYEGRDLIASTPAHVAKIDELTLAGNSLVTLGNDSSLAFVHVSARHISEVRAPCTSRQRGVVGIGMVQSCGEEGNAIVVGSRFVTTVDTQMLVFDIAVDDGTDRVAITTHDGVSVFDRDGSRRATLDAAHDPKSVTFLDADHLAVTRDDGVWRWTLPSSLDRISTATDVTAVSPTANGFAFGHTTGLVELVVNGRLQLKHELGERVDHLVASPDRKWLVATLASGAAAVIDTRTGAVVRRLASAGHSGTSASSITFDRTGDLLLRSGATVSIWDRVTGEPLVWDLDLFGTSKTGRFRLDGRLELAGAENYVLDIPRDDRPVDAILRDIECHVPLRATGDRLEPVSVPACPP